MSKQLSISLSYFLKNFFGLFTCFVSHYSFISCIIRSTVVFSSVLLTSSDLLFFINVTLLVFRKYLIYNKFPYMSKLFTYSFCYIGFPIFVLITFQRLVYYRNGSLHSYSQFRPRHPILFQNFGI